MYFSHSSGYWNSYMKILNLLLMRPSRHGKAGDQQKLGIFHLPNPMLPVELTPANLFEKRPCSAWPVAVSAAHLQPCSSHLGRWHPPAGDALCWHVLCSEEPKCSWWEWWEHWGAVCLWGHLPATRGAPGVMGLRGRLGPPSALLPVSLCLQVLQGEEWCSAGHRQRGRKGRKDCEGRGTKGNSLTESRGGYGLVFIFNNGQLWIFTWHYFRSQARLFYASSVPEFPLQLSESKWYYLQLLQESRISRGSVLGEWL